MIDLINVKSVYHSRNIDDIAFVRFEFSTADALAKTKNQLFLIITLTSNTIAHPIDKWNI